MRFIHKLQSHRKWIKMECMKIYVQSVMMKLSQIPYVLNHYTMKISTKEIHLIAWCQSQGRFQTLSKGKGASWGSSEKGGLLRHYLPYFINFTNENDKFSNKRGGCQPPASPSGSATESILTTSFLYYLLVSFEK